MLGHACPNSHVEAVECRNVRSEANPFDFAAGLAAHARMPVGRTINLQNAAAEDAKAHEEWLAERRAQWADERARRKASEATQ